ncbi:MAG: SusC/RagA family TonB-linked outer membrane protein [Bacteroidales bacterium]|nr:SusC/RagA family TonB-linked outer membrane protein [Bacteroidales bacterium]
MKKVKLLLSALMILAATAIATAQNIRVTGVVTDANGEPLPGATVMVQGTTNGTATGADGSYSLTVPSNATLVATMVGYIDEVADVRGRSTVNFGLKEDSELLENSVVVGYGSAKKIGNLVGSVTTVRSDIVKNAPSSSALDQLQGQVAGLSVLTTGGMAGNNATSMRLHGIGSLDASSTPLYIIDGTPSSSYTIQSMNPNDILSVSVLKDASSTSIYGSRAANGVVYITTKSGAYNSDAHITVRSQYGISTLASKAIYENVMDGDELIDFWLRAGLVTPAQIQSNYLDNGYTHNTKWYKFYQNLNTPQYQNDVTVEGGGQKVAYVISASQFHQQGTAIGNFYDRYTVRTNVQGHPKNWLKIGINFNISMDKQQGNSYWSTNNLNGGLSYLQNPLYPAYDENGELYTPRFPNNMVNPDVLLDAYPRLNKHYGINGGAYVEIEPIKHLKIRSQIGTDTRLTMTDNRNNVSSPIVTSGSRSKSTTLMTNNTITNTIEYAMNFNGDHDVTLLAGHEGIDNKSEGLSGSSSGQTEQRLLRLQDGTQSTFSISNSLSESRFNSFFGHADYSYMGKYNVDLTVRDDASSRFGKNVRHATFWSAGAKWNARNEAFVRNTPWLNDFSVKVSYGTQGNAGIGDYTHLGLIGKSTNYAESANSWVISQPANKDLTWEKQGLFTVGVSTRVFNRFSLEVEAYHRKTTNMLLDVPYPYTSGFSTVTANVGGLTNTGVDITLGIDILNKADYYLRTNVVFNYNKQKVTELFDAAWDEELQRYRWEMPSYGMAYVQGKPIMFYSPIYAGVDPEDGAPMWYLPGDDPDVVTKDPARTTKTFDEDALMQNTGMTYDAPINGGFGFEVGWKIFSLRADFSFVLKKYLLNNDMYFYANPIVVSGYNVYRGVSDFWTPEHRDAKYPDWSKGYVLQFDTHLYENASFLRLKNLQFGIDLPNKWMESQNVFKKVKFTFTGRNLLTFTKFTGIDPEVDSNLSMGIVGNSKQFLFGVELGF